MGQRLFEDKITTLSESGGTITLAAGARLTIGGQQYTTTAALTVAADVANINERYQVYAVRNAGNTELVTSQNENSIGPSGYSAWKLVGSYTTDWETAVFGEFYNIDGIPKNRIYTDFLLTNTTTPGDVMRIDTLRVGTTYEVMAQLRVYEEGQSNSLNRFDFIAILEDATGNDLAIVAENFFDNDNVVTDYRHTAHLKRTLTTVDPTLRIRVTTFTGTELLGNNSTFSESGWQITERNDLDFDRPIKDL